MVLTINLQKKTIIRWYTSYIMEPGKCNIHFSFCPLNKSRKSLKSGKYGNCWKYNNTIPFHFCSAVRQLQKHQYLHISLSNSGQSPESPELAIHESMSPSHLCMVPGLHDQM